ncbi:UvrD-helicase domain-containing protein [Acidisphaera sp. S103]|uniref:UvrD-helicase domain-containing protein n=1 Tax=Acidisphaera sp. S103 TaxID=1747223 RepID=UPI001C209867|nr:UvrD-helicase domain-containing protein [Acidisphaera sp. S103]
MAHWVANLIVNGVDPRRILLMTFSRRAVPEMTRRVESICSVVPGAKADVMTARSAGPGGCQKSDDQS